MSERIIHDYRLRKELCICQGYRCSICGLKLITHRAVSLDHVWPVSRGGYDGPGNLLATHKVCNTDKGDRLPTGCELIWLVSVCDVLGVPLRLKPDIPWIVEGVAA